MPKQVIMSEVEKCFIVVRKKWDKGNLFDKKGGDFTEKVNYVVLFSNYTTVIPFAPQLG